MADQHYFSAEPEVESDPRTLTLVLPDGIWELATDRGVFAYRQVDAATKLLLTTAPAPDVAGPILDLGCGYGAIAAVWGRREPNRTVWAVDINRRALALTRQNTTGMNVNAAAPDEVPADISFAAIYSNPPIRIGKAALHELLQRWLTRLAPGGIGYFVVSKNLGADSLTQWLTENNWFVSRIASRGGNRILAVGRAADNTSRA